MISICRRCEQAFGPERARASIEAANTTAEAKRAAFADVDRGYCVGCHLLINIQTAPLTATARHAEHAS